jgi:sugar phosphate isomerase/epimerase
MARALVLAAGTVQVTPFLDRLAPARAAGFDAVSMFASDYEALTAASIGGADLRRRVADAGLAITEVEIVGNWLPGARRKPGIPAWLVALLDRMTPERVIAIAAAVGARGITLGEMFGIEVDVDRAAEAFAMVCARAADHGLTVALEFIPTGGIADLDQAAAIVERAGAGNGGLLVDAWHFFRSGSRLDRLAALPGHAIKSIQLCDAPATAEPDLDHAMVHDRLLPGEGALDLPGLLAALAYTGTDAPIAIEVFSDALATLQIDEIARRCAAAAQDLLPENAQ